MRNQEYYMIKTCVIEYSYWDEKIHVEKISFLDSFDKYQNMKN